MKAVSILTILPLFISFSAFAKPLAIGVVEQPQCKKKSTAAARLLFLKTGGKWVALNKENDSADDFAPSKLAWTIALRGMALGEVKLSDPNPSERASKAWYYGRDKLYRLRSRSLPLVRNRGRAFKGWCEAPTFRPLVLVSQPRYVDPDQWKPFSPSAAYKERLFVPVRLIIGRFKAIRCPKGARAYEPFDYGPEQLVIYKSFRSASGQELVSIGIDKKVIGCDGPPLPEWSGNWFLLSGDRIDFIGNELELVDAGDYDGDGSSELLFWHSGYNKDGYVLVYDRFRQKLDYLWSYH